MNHAEDIKNMLIEAFDKAKINYNDNIIDFIINKAIPNNNDIINVLYNGGYDTVAKEYEKLDKVNLINVLNYTDLVNNYIDINDWRVKENSTVTYSIGGLILSNSGAVTANYWLNNIYDKEIRDAHKNADIHIHDLSMLAPYCAGWNLKTLIKEGLGGVPSKITSAPAKHLHTLCNQMVNFLGILQNEWAGAQAFSSFDTYLAPFIKVDNLSYEQTKQCIQSFIFGVNTPSRWGTQSPFSNITLDWTVPADLKDMPAIVGGKEMDFTYGDCKKEMDMVNKAFIEIMIEGDANGRGFQYPIPTYSITKDFDWSNTDNNRLLFEMTAKYGTPYFSNYVNSDMEPSDVRSMCVTADSMVWCKLNGKTKHITIEELYNSKEESKQILTRFGYRAIKELQKFEYAGDLLEFTTESGKKITSTVDHEHVVYNNERSRICITDGTTRKYIKPGENIPDGFTKIAPAPSGKIKDLIKKKAFEIEVGDYFTCRHRNPGERRLGKSYEEIYGSEKAKKIRQIYSEQRIGSTPWNKGATISEDTKNKISESVKGHYVSENCKKLSSERWQGLNNPIHNQEYWNKYHESSCITSKYELQLIKELNSLGLVINEDYIHQYCVGDKICDFYIKDKNLIIEIETNFIGCSYNDDNYKFKKNYVELIEKYNYIKSKGYNLLVYNPEDALDTYRKYINNCEKIVSINKIPFNGFVYDLEVNCDDICGDTTMYHTFYANEILTGNCCRLRLDLRELRKKSGGYFGSGENTGSVGVVTINLPRISYLSNNEKDFYNRLDKMMDICAKSLKIKRNTVTELLKRGLYPYTKRYLGNFDNHFSTIATIGMNEMCLNAKWLKRDLTDVDAQKFTINVLNHMRERLSDYQEQYGDLYNLEAAPAESTTYRLAKHDKEKFPNIITAAGDYGTPYYTNSSHLPVGFTEDIFSALDIQDELQTLYTSGTVFHAFIGEKLPDWKAAANIVRKIAENYKLPYYTLSPTYSICHNHGYINGEAYKCPECNENTEVYSRITGYYRPVQNWNDGKLQEFKDRKNYNINNSVNMDGIENSNEQINNNDDSNFENCVSCNIENILYHNYSIKLFATKTCPKCKIAAQLLEKNGINFEKLYVEDNMELAKSLGLKQAPTLWNELTNEFVVDLQEIKKYIELLID